MPELRQVKSGRGECSICRPPGTPLMTAARRPRSQVSGAPTSPWAVPALAALADGEVVEWGVDCAGRNLYSPEVISGLSGIAHVAVGVGTFFAWDVQGILWAWGDNTDGPGRKGAAGRRTYQGDRDPAGLVGKSGGGDRWVPGQASNVGAHHRRRRVGLGRRRSRSARRRKGPDPWGSSGGAGPIGDGVGRGRVRLQSGRLPGRRYLGVG